MQIVLRMNIPFIVSIDIIKDFFPKPNDFKEFAKECMFNLDLENELKGLTFEN